MEIASPPPASPSRAISITARSMALSSPLQPLVTFAASHGATHGSVSWANVMVRTWILPPKLGQCLPGSSGR